MKDKMSDIGVFKCQQRSSHSEGSASIAAVQELLKGLSEGRKRARVARSLRLRHTLFMHIL